MNEEHGYAGMTTVERNVQTPGFAEMDVECTAYLCRCGEPFRTREELEDHVFEKDPAIQI